MKKLSLLFVLLLSIVIVNAHSNYGASSDFNLKLWNNASFKIYVDNYEYGRDNFFSIQNIQPGIHNVKVVQRKRNPNGYGMLTRVMYNGKVRIPVNSRVLATVTPNRKLQLKISKKRVRNTGHHYSHGNYNNGNSNVNCNNNYGYVMNNNSFNGLVATLDNESFESNKLKIVKQALLHNNLTTNQVITIVNQFTFDSNRLKVAKMAYRNTVDKENYFLVNNSFTFSSSIASLNKYINQI